MKPMTATIPCPRCARTLTEPISLCDGPTAEEPVRVYCKHCEKWFWPDPEALDAFWPEAGSVRKLLADAATIRQLEMFDD